MVDLSKPVTLQRRRFTWLTVGISYLLTFMGRRT